MQDAGIVSRNNNLEVLRLLAALQVFYMHTIYALDLWPGPAWFFRAAQTFPGVVVFFVISGFLVTDSYLRTPSAKGFMRKRALRIYPGLIANIAILELAITLTGGITPSIHFLRYGLYFAIYSLTGSSEWANYFVSAPYNSYGMFPSYPSGVLWTLTVELTFYLCLPFLLEVWRRTNVGGWALIAALFAISLLLSQNFDVSSRYHPFVSLTVAPYFWIFAFGVAARLAWPVVKKALEGKALLWLCLHAALSGITIQSGASASIYFQAPDLWVFLRVAALACLALSLAFTMPQPNLLRGYDISYGVYLYHMLILELLRASGVEGSARLWPAAMLGVIAAGTLSYLVVERPFLRGRKRQHGRIDGNVRLA